MSAYPHRAALARQAAYAHASGAPYAMTPLPPEPDLTAGPWELYRVDGGIHARHVTGAGVGGQFTLTRSEARALAAALITLAKKE